MGKRQRELVLKVPPLFAGCEDVEEDIDMVEEQVKKERIKENGDRLEQSE